MRRVVRIVLAWVLVIAMPVQGLAASAMLFCGPGHGSAGAAAHGHGHGHGHGHAAGAAGHDHAALGHGVHRHAAAQDAVAAHDAAAGAAGLVAPHGGGSCSACAACCVVLALPARFSLPDNTGPVHMVRMSPAMPMASHPPDGLDRPPRAGLA